MDLKVKIDDRPLRIRISERGQIETVRVALAVNRERCARGINAYGEAFPEGKGKKRQLDMDDSGRMLDDVQVYSTRYQFQATYARTVDEIYKFAGVYDAEGIAEIERRVAALLDAEVAGEED